jgi:hypothetical protein
MRLTVIMGAACALSLAAATFEARAAIHAQSEAAAVKRAELAQRTTYAECGAYTVIVVAHSAYTAREADKAASTACAWTEIGTGAGVRFNLSER